MTAESKKKWWSSMIAKHKTEEGVRQFMAASAKKAEHTGAGGFKYMSKHDPKRLSEISKIGGKVGKRTK